MPKYCFLLVAFISFWLVRCSDRQEVPVPAVTAVADTVVVDTVGVSAMVDTAFLLLRDSQVERAMEQMKKVFEIYHRAGLASIGQKKIQVLTIEAQKQKQSELVYKLLDWTVGKTEKSSHTDTIAGKLLYLKGYFLHSEGKSLEANIFYEMALEKLPESQFFQMHLPLFINISQTYIELGDYKKGEEYGRQALLILDKYMFEIPPTSLLPFKQKALRALGWALYEQQKNKEALDIFHKALIIAPEERKSDILTFISKCYLNENQFDKAFSIAKDAMGFAIQFPDEDISWYADALHQLARCYWIAGQTEQALYYFNKALPVAERAYNSSHRDCYKIKVYIGDVYYKLQQYDKAQTAYNEAIQMSQSLPASDTSGVADYWVMRAVEGLTQVWHDRMCQSKSPEDYQQFKNYLDQLLLIQENRFNVFETDESKIEITGIKFLWHERGIKQALINGDSSSAILYLLDSKASLFREHLRQERAVNNVPDSLAVPYRLLKQQIAETEGKRQRGEYISERHLLEIKLRMDRIKDQIKPYESSDIKKTATDIDSLQSRLPELTVMLNYLYGDSSVYVFVMDKHKKGIFQIENRSSLAETIQQLTNSIDLNSASRSTQDFIDASRLAYMELLEKPIQFISGSSPEANRLWVIPDGPLNYLPFNVLLTIDVSTGPVGVLPYLIKKYAVSYASMPEHFFQPSATTSGLKPYGGWGITYDSLTLKSIEPLGRVIAKNTRDLGPLLKAREEIVLSSSGLKADTWFDRKATKQSFIQHAGDYQICHLAMHALASNTTPELSKLIFSADSTSVRNNDHFLYASSIYGLTIKADLMVLSACNTAGGEILKGEGVSSIGRAFQFAGAKSVLMTQWSIQDQSASVILTEFFKFLKQGLPKDIALQKAQLAMLERAPLTTPADWAGFILSGSTQPVIIEQSFKATNWLILLIPVTLLLYFFLKKTLYLNRPSRVSID